MSDIKVWGCGKTREQRKFKNVGGKNVVVIDQQLTCRYDNVVNEEEDPEEELELVLDGEEETEEERPADLPEPVLNEVKIGTINRSQPNQHKDADRELEAIRTYFKRFLQR